MRYERLSDLPATVRMLPPEGQVAWMDAYNRAWSRNDPPPGWTREASAEDAADRAVRVRLDQHAAPPLGGHSPLSEEAVEGRVRATDPNPREAAPGIEARAGARARGWSPGVKKVVWTALVTLVSAASAALAVRAAEKAWRRLVRENPPAIPAWARLLVGKPVRKQVSSRLHAGIP